MKPVVRAPPAQMEKLRLRKVGLLVKGVVAPSGSRTALTVMSILLAIAKVAYMEHQALCVPVIVKTVLRGSEEEGEAKAAP